MKIFTIRVSSVEAIMLAELVRFNKNMAPLKLFFFLWLIKSTRA